jgi:hypothetical protein
MTTLDQMRSQPISEIVVVGNNRIGRYVGSIPVDHHQRHPATPYLGQRLVVTLPLDRVEQDAANTLI